MIIKENDRPHLRQLIKEIKNCRGYSEGEYGFKFVIKNEDIKLDNGLISTVEDRRQLMVELEKREAIKILKTELPEFDIYSFLIRILQPEFDKIYKDVENKDKENSKETIFLQKQKIKEYNYINFPQTLSGKKLQYNF